MEKKENSKRSRKERLRKDRWKNKTEEKVEGERMTREGGKAEREMDAGEKVSAIRRERRRRKTYG